MADADAVCTIEAICNVSSLRASELLEAANGSVERAVEIHLNQQKDKQNAVYSVAAKPGDDSNQQKNSPAASSSPRKSAQRQLDTFFPQKLKRARTKNKAANNFEENDTPFSLTDDRKVAAQEKDSSLSPKPLSEAKRAPQQQQQQSLSVDASPPYSLLVKALVDITSTTKRTIKLDVLKNLLKEIIQSIGGIHRETTRKEDAQVLTCSLDLLLGRLSSSTDGSSIVLQVSGSAVSSAVQIVTGASRQEIRSRYQREGDLGDVAASLFISKRQQQFFTPLQPQTPLNIMQVHQQLKAIANVSTGKGSQRDRENLTIKLLKRSSDKDELRFLVRTLLGNMRLGATMKTIIVALANAVLECQQKSDRVCLFISDPARELEQVFNVCHRQDKICVALLSGGIPYASKHCSIEVGSPIQPMLANPVRSFSQIESFMTAQDGKSLQAVAELKYDGVRCQAHWDGKRVIMYSRNLLDNTQQYPDAVKAILDAKTADLSSFIIDSEIVGVTPDASCTDGVRLLPFQDLSTRRGTKNAGDAGQVAVRVYAFDIMSINGRSLLNVSLWERQTLLRQHFCPHAGFAFAKSTTFEAYNEMKLQQTLQQAIEEGAEGLMMKLTGKEANDAVYESGARSQLWKKVKKDYVGAFADTIDVVPIGAWFGNGRKAQKGFLSPVLFAVYDDEEGVYRSISRCMSFSDAMYAAMRDFYFHGTPYPPGVGMETETTDAPDDTISLEVNASETDEALTPAQEGDGILEIDDDGVNEGRVNCFANRPPSSLIVTNESPPIWLKPLEVFEVSFADLSLSKMHTAGKDLVDDEQGRGVALRFPRFKRRRPDKDVEQATTSAEVAYLFSQQSKIK